MIIDLHEDEDVAVLVSEGEFGGIWARTQEEVVDQADLIHETMITLKKKNEYNSGYWVWVFSNNFTEINGNKL